MRRPIQPLSPRSRVILAGCLLAILATGAYLWIGRASAERRGFVTATVERAPIAATVLATGTLNAVVTVQVGTYVSGPIREIYVDYNSPVSRGQVVARIDPDPFEVKVQQAEAELATAHARVRKAAAERDYRKFDLERQETLNLNDVISAGRLEEKQSAYLQSEAQLALDRAGVALAEAGLAEARINLSYTDIVSPVDGVVLSRNVDVGQTVAASFQTPTLFLIAEDLAQMRVNAHISESDIGRIRVAQPVRFAVDAYPEREFVGVVSQQRNAPVIDRSVVTYDVVIDVENQDLALKPGMTATVSIITAERADTTVVPLRALRFRPDVADREPGDGEPPASKAASFVWVLGPDGKLRRNEVETGIRNDEYVEVSDGTLSPGDVLAVAYERE